MVTSRSPGGAATVRGRASNQRKPRSQGSPGTYHATDDHGEALAVTVRLEPQNSLVRWSISLRNLSSDPIEIGDVALPLPMHFNFNGKEPPTASVLKHSFISGHGSFLFWMRSNSVGPYLVMTPERETHLEYWDHTPSRPRPDAGAGAGADSGAGTEHGGEDWAAAGISRVCALGCGG